MTSDDYQTQNQDALRAFNAGIALVELVEQLDRLRRCRADLVPFGWSEEQVLGSVLDEIQEVVDADTDGRPGEIRDAMSALLQLMIVMGADPIQEIKKATAKLAWRIDRVDEGVTWEQAKIEERMRTAKPTPASPGVETSPAIEDGESTTFTVPTRSPEDCDHDLSVSMCGYEVQPSHANSDGETDIDVVDLCLRCHRVRLWGSGWITPPPPDEATAARLATLLLDGCPCPDCGHLMGDEGGCSQCFDMDMTVDEALDLAKRWAYGWSSRATWDCNDCLDEASLDEAGGFCAAHESERIEFQIADHDVEKLLGWVRRGVRRAESDHDSFEPPEDSVIVWLSDTFGSAEWVGRLWDAAIGSTPGAEVIHLPEPLICDSCKTRIHSGEEYAEVRLPDGNSTCPVHASCMNRKS